MNMMLSRKPQLDQIQISDNDYVETPIKEVIRLNKFIANSGICSRREADQYIQAGVVTVNGEVVTSSVPRSMSSTMTSDSTERESAARRKSIS